jgi:hypothetical protein
VNTAINHRLNEWDEKSVDQLGDYQLLEDSINVISYKNVNRKC